MLTPYIWGDYKIVVMPPSFPVGGVPNPLLSFVSPTIVTGDRSRLSLAIYEIMHSWTGNDVTCENWSNLWLNQGMSVYTERKISKVFYGESAIKADAFLSNITAT